MGATPRGIVLFAHGSRDERWRAPVEAVARRVVALDPSAGSLAPTSNSSPPTCVRQQKA